MSARRAEDLLDVGRVGGDDDIIFPPERSLNDGNVDNVIVPCLPGQFADMSRLVSRHVLDCAASK